MTKSVEHKSDEGAIPTVAFSNDQVVYLLPQ